MADDQPIILDDELEQAEAARAGCRKLLAECGKVIVGQREVLEQLLIALLSPADTALLVGVPGLAKTLMIRTLADSLAPDLQPGAVYAGPDAVGHHRHRDAAPRTRATGTREFRFLQGPIFSQRGAGRRDQPHPAEDASRAARGHAGAAGDRRPATGTCCPTRSSSWRPRTRSSKRGRTRCPRRSRTGSCSPCTVGYPSRGRTSSAIIETTTSAARPQAKPERVVDRRRADPHAGAGPAGAGGGVRHPVRAQAGPADPADTPRSGEPPEPERCRTSSSKYVTWFGAGPRAGQNLILAAKARRRCLKPAGRTWPSRT